MAQITAVLPTTTVERTGISLEVACVIPTVSVLLQHAIADPSAVQLGVTESKHLLC